MAGGGVVGRGRGVVVRAAFEQPVGAHGGVVPQVGHQAGGGGPGGAFGLARWVCWAGQLDWRGVRPWRGCAVVVAVAAVVVVVAAVLVLAGRLVWVLWRAWSLVVGCLLFLVRL